MIGFAAVSALGGFASTPELLFVARGAQGVFAATLAPAALALVTVTFTEARERSRAFGVFGAVQGAGGAVGLLLGGVLTEYVDWRWSLFVNVPIAFVAAALALYSVRESRLEKTHRRYDVPSAALATAGSFGLVAGFTLAADEGRGWRDPLTLVTLVASGAILLAFVVRQHRAEHPMLPLRVVTDRVRGGAYLTTLLAAGAMFGMLLFLTYYLQGRLGLTPLRTGLVFLVFSVGIIVSAVLVSALLPRMGPRPLMVSGMVLGVVGMLTLTTIDHPRSLILLLSALALLGFGLGVVFVAVNNVALSGIDANDAGVASALVNTTQQLGGALGVALLNTIASGVTARAAHNADVAGYRAAFAVASALLLASTFVVLVTAGRPFRTGKSKAGAYGPT
ncbi:MFS transporter [Actinopolymorpha pittospori]|uniref:MFS family permease n=1 Tax=Actinopolymorpha pittospori TaxID=648752 RepID=A0A927R8C1_9ACTN|nr:MFS transporter [Actinopolymorpha pittospori]MBE1606542.1 MFS family permease [Actinopolymorpha pittospori]